MDVNSTDWDMLIQMYFDIDMEYADTVYTLAVAHKIYVHTYTNTHTLTCSNIFESDLFFAVSINCL